MGRAVTVMVVDDSAVVREILARELDQYSDIGVVATAMSADSAQRKLEKHRPDVILLDLQMPGIDGIAFLKQVMRECPTPVVLFTAYAGPGSSVALEALAIGAVAVVSKPDANLGSNLSETLDELVTVIREASQAKFKRRRGGAALQASPPGVALRPKGHKSSLPSVDSRVIAIGASTGGTEALQSVLTELPDRMPPIVLVIHMPAGFTQRYSARLNSMCALTVREAVDGETLTPGHAVFAPGNRHLSVVRRFNRYLVSLDDGPKVNRHRPSVDVLFNSMAAEVGKNGMGVLLTGMGADGARGLLEMRKSGGHTIAQDESTCVVFGMPREAARLGAAEQVCPLHQIGSACVNWVYEKS